MVKFGALALAVVVAAAYLALAFVYHSLNVFTPPERITSLGRTYERSRIPQLSFEELSEQRSPAFTQQYAFERVGTLLPNHPIYQWQNGEIRGQATPSAFVKWGDKYTSYQLLGGP